jgi:hypothetical protein
MGKSRPDEFKSQGYMKLGSKIGLKSHGMTNALDNAQWGSGCMLQGDDCRQKTTRGGQYWYTTDGRHCYSLGTVRGNESKHIH